MDILIENGIPAIVNKELWETVQNKFKNTKKQYNSAIDYLLSGKVFCGHCENLMNGGLQHLTYRQKTLFFFVVEEKKTNVVVQKNM